MLCFVIVLLRVHFSMTPASSINLQATVSSTPVSGVTAGRGRVPPKGFPPGNFWRQIGKCEAWKKVLKIENVEENEEKWKREGGK